MDEDSKRKYKQIEVLLSNARDILEDGNKNEIKEAQHLINSAKDYAGHVLEDKEDRQLFRERVKKLEDTYNLPDSKTDNHEERNYLHNKELSKYIKDDKSVQYHKNGVRLWGASNSKILMNVDDNEASVLMSFKKNGEIDYIQMLGESKPSTIMDALNRNPQMPLANDLKKFFQVSYNG